MARFRKGPAQENARTRLQITAKEILKSSRSGNFHCSTISIRHGQKQRNALFFGPPDLGFHAGARLPPSHFFCVFRPLYPPIRPALTGGPQQQSPLPKIELSEGSLPLPPAGKGNGSKKNTRRVSGCSGRMSDFKFGERRKK